MVVDVIPAPFMKWVGSKRGLLRRHGHLFPAPSTVKRLGLPFCGGGAVAFHYAGLPMLLSDTCPHLMTAFVAVRDHVDELLAELAFIERGGYTREHYDAIVELLNTAHTAPLARRAAWVFVVTQWGFNGLWRTNQKSEINTPFGKPSKPGTVPRLFDEANLRACAKALAKSTLAVLDFEEQVRRMEPRPGDFVYADPPFLPASDTANFTGYSGRGFTVHDHERLARTLIQIDDAGVRFAVSNSDTPLARKLFSLPRKGWTVARITRSGTVSSDTSGRAPVGEILVRNYGEHGETAR